MELEKGKTPYSDGTFECTDYPGCFYCQDGRCTFRVARIKIEISRACHQDIVECEVECAADYAMGLL